MKVTIRPTHNGINDGYLDISNGFTGDIAPDWDI